MSPFPSSPSTELTQDAHMATYRPPAGATPADLRMPQQHGGSAREIEDIRMMTSRRTLGTANGDVGLKPWERELVESQEVKRKATVAQLCELVKER